jgi:hypothetical protein
MIRLPNGGFSIDDKIYTPFVYDHRFQEDSIVNKHPELFYHGGPNDQLTTEHPGIVIISCKYNGLMMRVQSSSDSWEAIMPTFVDGGFYGSCCNREIDSDMVPRVFAGVRKDYPQYIREIKLTGIPVIRFPIANELYTRLYEVTLNCCSLREVPHEICGIKSLKRLFLLDNPELCEIPPQLLPQLHVLAISGTNVRTIWSPRVSDNHNWRFGSSLCGISPKFTLDNISLTVPIDALREIFARCAQPVVSAATAILAIPKRRIVKNFHRDIATLIARMIMETRGRAVWGDLARAFKKHPQ